jgi:hypothetical protein
MFRNEPDLVCISNALKPISGRSMKRLSSSEAVWPAIKKTWDELFDAFQWSKYAKLCSVAVLAEGIVVCYRFSVRNELTSELSVPDLRTVWDSPYIPLVIWAALSAIILLGFGYYTIIRLRFVLFHLLVFRPIEFRAGWELHGKTALRMFFACGLSWLVVFACIGIEAIVMAIGGVTLFTVRAADGGLDPGILLLMYLIAFLTGIALLVLVAVVRIILHDFILPHMALDHVGFWGAWSKFRKIFSAEKETFFWYMVLRILLSVIPWAIVATVATAVGYLLIWALSGSATGYDFLLGGTEDFRDYVRSALDVSFVLFGLATGVLLNFVLGGPLAVWTRNFALLYYAGADLSLLTG